ncbi:MAG TPA: serine/threonine-protein kinase, partial [Beutenbergiaceae bacterium]|nr:serine/threonine-protein kinase [Beutenbergiaceae bacterium]
MSEHEGALPDIPGYSILGVLGSGGMGTVYSGVDAESRDVAIKVLHPGLAGDMDVRVRLRREVSTLHRVKGAQVAQVLDAELEAPQAFIVTELIEGQDLAESVAQHGPLDEVELANLATGLAAALTSIHNVGVVHRDLKPGNVMLTDDGPVLIDFGISQILDDTRITRTGLVTGTPGYVDPVVLSGADPDELGDWWGWAALLVFASTGRPPFGSGPVTAVLTRAEAGRVDVEGLPDPIANVLTRALAPDPRERMAPADVIDVLEALAAGQDIQVPQPPAPPPPPSIPPRQAAHPPMPPTSVMGQPPSVMPTGGYVGAGQPWAGHQRQHVVEAWPDLPAQAPAVAVGPPRPRTLATFGLWLGLIAVSAAWPGVAIVGFVVGMVLLATLGSAGQELRKRRNWYGRRRRDVAVLLLTSPVHLVLGVLRSIPGLFFGGFLGFVVWMVVTQADPFVAAPVAVAVLTFVHWWFPPSLTAREGARMVLGVGGSPATGVWL